MASYPPDKPCGFEQTSSQTEQGTSFDGLLHPSMQSVPMDPMQTLIEYCPAAIALLDRDLRYLLVSRQWQENFGLGDRDLRGYLHYDLFPEAIRWQAIYQQGLAGEIERCDEDSFSRSDGTIDWLRWEIRPWYNSAGEIGGLVMFAELITQRRLAEQSLQQANEDLEERVEERTAELQQTIERLQAEIWERNAAQRNREQAEEERDRFFNLSPDMLCIAGFDGYFKRVNPSFERILGYTTEELLTKPFLELVHPDDRPATLTQVTALSQGEEIVRFENRYRCKNGSYRWLSWTSTPHTEDQLIYATARDVSDRKRDESERRLAAQKLRESQQRLELLIQQTPIAIIEWNQNFEVTEWNLAAENIFGYGKEEVLGRRLDFLIPQAAKQDIHQLIQLLLSQQSGNVHVNENLTKDGRTIICEWHNTPLVNSSGELISVASLGIDITERKQAEAALRESEARHRALLEAIPDLLFRYNRQGVHLDFFPSREWNTIVEPELFLGKPLDQVLPIEVARKIVAAINTALDSGTIQLIEYQLEFDGNVNDYEARIVTSGENEVTTIVRNISEQKASERDRKAAESALRESEQRFRDVSEAAGEYIWEIDANGLYTFVTDKAKAVKGYTPAELLGHSPLEFMFADDIEPVQAILQESSNRKGSFKLEYRDILPSGEIVWEEVNGIPMLDDRGDIIGFRGVGLSITERKHGEMELRETQNFLASVLENLPVSVFAKEAENLRFILWNTAAQELLGYTADEVIGNHDYDLFPEEQARTFTTQDRHVINSGKVVEIPEEPIQTVEGETRILKTTKTTILDSEGKPQYLLAIAEDITERKQAEAQLREKEQFLRTIYDGVECCIFVIDVLKNNEFRYVSYNQYAEQITGLSSADVAGKTPEERFGTVEGTRLCQTFTRCVETGTALTEEECLMFGDRQVWFLTTFNPLRNEDGQIYRIVATSSDITELKQAETQLKQQATDLEESFQELQHTQAQMLQSEKMSSLGQLVAGVAHEINNPVNFIFGNLNHANAYTQDLLSLLGLYQQHYPDPHPDVQAEAEEIDLDFLVEDLPKLLNSMRVGADRIQKIVASLRTFSRMDEAEMKAVDIHEGIDSTLMILQSRIKAKDSRPAIEIVKNYDNLPLVECYAGQLNQVFMNIVSNAIDAIEENLELKGLSSDLKDSPTPNPHAAPLSTPPSPTITISTSRLESNYVRITIADTGPGIPKDVRGRLFDPFFTTKPVGKGTGMGLSISYQIVTEKHGGSLYCLSEPGQGSEFIIQIPLNQR